VAVIFLKRRSAPSLETLIDVSDLKLASSISTRWFAGPAREERSNRIYVKANTPGKYGRTSFYLHRLITGAEKGWIVDHIDHNPLNNRRSNLRIVTQSENLQNISRSHIDSRTGIRGVSWSKATQKWEVQMQVNKVRYRLGFYDDIRIAEQVAINARRELMPFSPDAGTEIRGATPEEVTV